MKHLITNRELALNNNEFLNVLKTSKSQEELKKDLLYQAISERLCGLSLQNYSPPDGYKDLRLFICQKCAVEETKNKLAFIKKTVNNEKLIDDIFANREINFEKWSFLNDSCYIRFKMAKKILSKCKPEEALKADIALLQEKINQINDKFEKLIEKFDEEEEAEELGLELDLEQEQRENAIIGKEGAELEEKKTEKNFLLAISSLKKKISPQKFKFFQMQNLVKKLNKKNISFEIKEFAKENPQRACYLVCDLVSIFLLNAEESIYPKELSGLFDAVQINTQHAYNNSMKPKEYFDWFKKWQDENLRMELFKGFYTNSLNLVNCLRDVFKIVDN